MESEMKNIERFCKETGFHLEHGEIGFGHKCIGIENEHDCFVSYAAYDENWDAAAEHTAEPAASAYHKGQFLAVLIERGGTVEELDAWIGRILEKGYRLQEYADNSFLGRLNARKLVLKAVVDPISCSKCNGTGKIPFNAKGITGSIACPECLFGKSE